MRSITRYISTFPGYSQSPNVVYEEPATEEFIWYRLRQLSESPALGMGLFTGESRLVKSKYRDFRAYVDQARTYWDAASRTEGSSALLLYYYSALQLAKAELIETNYDQVRAGRIIHHGLQWKPSGNDSIRAERIALKTGGVFGLLHRKRTGIQVPNATSLKATSILSVIPEVGLEMRDFGTPIKGSMQGYYSIAGDETSAWSLVLLRGLEGVSSREPALRKLCKGYDLIPQSDFGSWREVFALSQRINGGRVAIFQAKDTFSLVDGVPDFGSAANQLYGAVGDHIRPPVDRWSDFVLTPALRKSDSFSLPLDLIRYVSVFYFSSLVRYAPVKLDSRSNGDQAFLADSVAREVPLGLLSGALDGITSSFVHFGGGDIRI